MEPWAELGVPAVLAASSGGKRWRSARTDRSDSTRGEVLDPAVRREELPAGAPEVLGELVERHEPEVLETSGPGPPADAAAADEVETAADAAGTADVASAAAGTGVDTEAGCCSQAAGVIFLFLS